MATKIESQVTLEKPGKLPDFLIIGGMRCGTTSLHELLRQQPSLWFPTKKEVHFFDRRNPDVGTSIDDYKRLFAGCPVDKLCGETTPDYLSSEGCDKYIHEVIPNAKLVVILRDPVERTWSHYLFSVLHKVETLDLRTALQEETERLKVKSDHTDIFFSYLQRSRYVEHLLRFETLFGRDRLKIVFFEELLSDPKQVLQQLLNFLGLSHEPVWVALPHLNKMSNLYRVVSRQQVLSNKRTSIVSRVLTRFNLGLTKQKQKLSAEDQEYLRSYFGEHNARLETWLGRSLPWSN